MPEYGPREDKNATRPRPKPGPAVVASNVRGRYATALPLQFLPASILPTASITAVRRSSRANIFSRACDS